MSSLATSSPASASTLSYLMRSGGLLQPDHWLVPPPGGKPKASKFEFRKFFFDTYKEGAVDVKQVGRELGVRPTAGVS
jgi:hypothetical protein